MTDRENRRFPRSAKIRWRSGAAKGTLGIPPIQEAFANPAPVPELAEPYKKGPTGRKPKDRTVRPKPPEPMRPSAPSSVFSRTPCGSPAAAAFSNI